MHRSPIALAVATVSLFALAPSPAGAMQKPGDPPPSRSPKDTHCIAEFDVTLDPGLSQTPSSGTFTTGGDVGTMVCDGLVNGFQVTGTGTRGEVGRYGLDGPNSCGHLKGKGDETWSLTMPTTGGPQHLTDFATVEYDLLQGGGVYGGTLESKRMYGTFTVTPIDGDCMTKPVTRAHVRCDEWIVEH